MDICKCGDKTKSYMVKEGKKYVCRGCGREDIDNRYSIEPVTGETLKQPRAES